MKAKHLLAYIQEGYTTIEVVFHGSNQPYTYKAWLADGIEVGDHVVVLTPSKGYTVVNVVAVHKTPHIDSAKDWTYKWVVNKVDDARYLSVQQKEEEFLESVAEAERVCARDQMVKQALEGLPEGTAGRKVFEEAVAKLRGSAFDLRCLGNDKTS